MMTHAAHAAFFHKGTTAEQKSLKAKEKGNFNLRHKEDRK